MKDQDTRVDPEAETGPEIKQQKEYVVETPTP